MGVFFISTLLFACLSDDKTAPNDTIDTNEEADDTPPITADTSEPTEDDTGEDDTGPIDDTATNSAYRVTQSISFNGVEVDVIINKPEGDSFDTLLVYHGTVWYDDQVLASAETTLNKFIEILDRTDMMVISVAYPEENLLMGENIIFAEAALLWLQNQAATDLGIEINRIFLGGHSQGGYLVTRLNTLHPTDGVMANCPGPLDMHYRCELEENNAIETSNQCQQLHQTFGSTSENPDAYHERSLINFTTGHTSPLLVIQGMQDAEVQLANWPLFKQSLDECTDCAEIQTFEAPQAGHPALFVSPPAMEVFNQFVQ